MSDPAVSFGASGARGYMSYSHDDHEAVQRLSRHLIPSARAVLGIDFWTDAAVTAGGHWSKMVADALARANVFVLCMSANYLASEFLYNIEFPAIKARIETSGALAIPVILSPCSWWGFVGDYQAVPARGGRIVPISNWRPLEDGFREAATQVIHGIEHHLRPQVGKSELQPRPIPPAPDGHHKIAPRDIDRAVEAVVSRRAAKSHA